MRSKKIYAAVLAAVLAAGSTAVYAYAAAGGAGEGETAPAATSVASFAELKTAIEAGTKNINVTATIEVTETIDLNGATLTAAASLAGKGKMILISANGVTISNGTLNGNNVDVYVVDVSVSGNLTENTATLSNLTVLNQDLTNAGYPDTVTAHSIIRNYGVLTLNNCTVKAGKPAAVKVEEGATLNVKGGSISGKEIGITTFGTTTLDNNVKVTSESGTNALYVLTWGTYDSKTTVNNATVDGTIVYGASSGATKAPEVEVKADATLVNSGYTKATNATMNTLPAGKTPTLTIDPDADIQLASTEDLDPILTDALKNVENVTNGDGDPIEVGEDGTVSDKTFAVATGTIDASKGSVTVSPENAKKGATVTIEVTPADNYEVDTVSVTDAGGNSVTVNETAAPAAARAAAASTYTFTMPASAVTVNVTFKTAGGSENLGDTGLTYVAPVDPVPTSGSSASGSASSDATSSDADSSDVTSSDTSVTESGSSDDTTSSGEGSGNNSSGSTNPGTGVAMGVFPVVLAAGTVVVIAKRKK